MSEKHLVQYCSPTLAGIKTGSLFSCAFCDEKSMRENLRGYNQMLRNKGLRLLPLKYQNGRALVYVYRPDMLSADLKNNSARELLRSFGYKTETPERCIIRLMERLSENSGFPHEIGLFLGYPPEDVSGFIENKACGYKCVGCWKVYGDEEKAKRLFEMYKKCTALYKERLESGSSVESLAVEG